MLSGHRKLCPDPEHPGPEGTHVVMLLLPLSCVPLSLTLPTSETQLPSVNAGFRLKSIPQVLSFSPDVQCSDLFNVLKNFLKIYLFGHATRHVGSQFPGQGLIAGEVKAEKKKKNTRHKEVKANLPSQFGLFGEDLCPNYLFFF